MAEPAAVNAWFQAARRGDLEVLRENIVRIDKDRREPNSGQTALMLACFNDHPSCVEWLIKKQHANLNLQDDRYRETALLKAAREGAYECMKLLLDHGADKNLEGFRHHTPLMSAVLNGHTRCVELLVEKGAMLNIVDDLGSTPLMKAAFANNSVCVQSLLQGGALVNITDNNGQTALIKAALGGDPTCVELLLTNGAHTSIKDYSGVTALIRIVSKWLPKRVPKQWILKNHFECIRQLCEKGSDPNSIDHNNETVLMKAAAIGQLDCVKYLLDHTNAQIDIFNDQGQTAITLAAKHGYSRILQLLCDKDQQNTKGLSDLRGLNPLLHASQNGHGECVQTLVAFGVDLDVIDPRRTTPLMFMARAGCEAAVRALVEAGADVERRNSRGQTALDLAEDEACRRLLQS